MKRLILGKSSRSTSSAVLLPICILLLTAGACFNAAMFLNNYKWETASTTDVPQITKRLDVEVVDLKKACPPSLKINAVNSHSPPAQLMDMKYIISIVRHWYKYTCRPEACEEHNTTHTKSCPSDKCNFASLGQLLLQHAVANNKTLLTLQVGGMDGYSGDPMYEMFVTQQQEGLENWLPIIVEPMPANYDALLNTYADIASRGLGCAIPINAAVAYDENKTECSFCRFNVESTDEICVNHPDWMRLELGTLDCDYSKKFFGVNFERCILQTPLPCGPIANLLLNNHITPHNIAMLQIDIEGYEAILLPKFMREVPIHLLPPVIHFEAKVMQEYDEKGHGLIDGRKRIDIVSEALSEKGYVMIEVGDWLALKVH